MTRVFVFEYLSGGGVVDNDPEATESLLPQGLAMRDAIAADLLSAGDCELSVATCARAGTVPRRALAVQPRPGELPLAFVARQAQQHDAVWVVAPETGGCLAAFERLVAPPRWLGCNAEAIGLASSKGATLARLAAHGITTPLAFAAESVRWVVKPDDGAGAVATWVHGDEHAARADQAQRPGAWAEPWVDGEALSLSLLAGSDRTELLSVNRQRIAVDVIGCLAYGGVDIDVMPADDPRRRSLAALARRVTAAVPGLQGFVGVDIVWHAQRGPVVIEANPRVTCAYVGLSARLRRNLGAEILAAQRLGLETADA